MGRRYSGKEHKRKGGKIKQRERNKKGKFQRGGVSKRPGTPTRKISIVEAGGTVLKRHRH
jgi:hypothetical protein